MSLKLKIISDNASWVPKPRWTCGVKGGRIGRLPDNDWVLSDPDRYISGHHAEIEHRSGGWWLMDRSTNGTFVNESPNPLGKEDDHQLEDGDRLRIGEYDIEVEIGDEDDSEEEEEPDDDLGPNASLALQDEDLESAFEVKSLISPRRKDRMSQPDPDPEPEPEPDPEPEEEGLADPLEDIDLSALPDPDDESEPEPETVRPQPAALRALMAETPKSADVGTPGTGLAELCKGAGVDIGALPEEARTEALGQAGMLLRETMIGFSELASTRADFASEFGVTSGARHRDATSPVVTLAAVEPLLTMLLAGRGPADNSAADEIRRLFDRARHHELAMQVAMREAMSAVIEKLDPDKLEQDLSERGRLTGTPELQAKLWQRYRELFRGTVQTAEGGLPATFLVAFARAYEALVAGGDTPQRDDD